MNAFKLITAALLSLALIAGSAVAHIGVKTTNIADAAVIDTLPKKFSFSFSQPVKLIAFSVTTHDGKVVDLAYKLPKSRAKSFSVPLPDLSPGHYTIEWRTLSKDGHPMTGKSTFELK
jgi:methionine-rich copper-binding protein CopC